MKVIELDPAMAETLAEFLNRKFMERHGKEGRQYTIREFATEIGIDDKTLTYMMNQREGSKRIAFDNLRALISAFGREFTDEFDLTPKF